MKKTKLIIIFIILLLNITFVSAEDRQILFEKDISVYNINKFHENFSVALRISESSRKALAAIGDNTEYDLVKGNVKGKVLFKSRIGFLKGAPSRYMLLEGDDIVLKRQVIKGKKGLYEIDFITNKGKIITDNFELSCKEDCEMKIKQYATFDYSTSPLIDVKGEAILKDLNKKSFQPILLKDITSFGFGVLKVNKQDLISIYGYPLKKTSKIQNIQLKSSGRVLYSQTLSNDNNHTETIELEKPAYIYNNEGDTTFILSNQEAKAIIFDNGKQLMQVEKGSFKLYYNDEIDYNDCVNSGLSCILITKNQLKIKAVDRSKEDPLYTIVNANTNRHIVFEKIALKNLSTNVLKRGNDFLLFSYDNLEKSRNNLKEYYFKTDFTAYLYSQTDRTYHEYTCLWRQKKCYYDGKLTKKGLLDIKICETDDDCNNNEICSSTYKCNKDIEDCHEKRCIKKAKCFKDENTNGPVSLLFIPDGYLDKKSFKKDVNDLMFNGLYTMKPFDTLDAKAAFSIWYTDPVSIPQTFSGDPLMDIAKSYKDSCEASSGKNIDHVIVLSKGGKSYRAFAHFKRDYIAMPVSFNGVTQENKWTFIHEFGHMFAKLADEYLLPGFYKVEPQFPNCAKDIKQAKEWLNELGLDNSAYGNFKYKGCGGDCVLTICSGYIRPSEDSIMRDQRKGYLGFNVVSEEVIKNKLRETLGMPLISDIK